MFWALKAEKVFKYNLKQKTSPLSVSKSIGVFLYEVEMNRLIPLMTPLNFAGQYL
jgi:hypothetical protein